MEQLDNKWILVKDTKCPEKDTSPATLGLTNMAGVYKIIKYCIQNRFYSRCFYDLSIVVCTLTGLFVIINVSVI